MKQLQKEQQYNISYRSKTEPNRPDEEEAAAPEPPFSLGRPEFKNMSSEADRVPALEAGAEKQPMATGGGSGRQHCGGTAKDKNPNSCRAMQMEFVDP